MRCRFVLLTLVGLSVFAAALTSAQVTSQSGGYLFRLKLHKGEKLNFKIPFTIENLQKTPLNMRLGMKLTVTNLTSKGIATLVVGKLDTGKLQFPGFSGQGGSFEVDRLGRVQANGQMLGFCVRYPQYPVPVGGHFVSTVWVLSGGLGSGLQDSQATFTLVGFTGTGEHKCAKLSFRVAGNRAPPGSILVRLSDGVIDRYFTKFTAEMPGAKPNDRPLVVTATVIRQ